jgi:hypothetical protein
MPYLVKVATSSTKGKKYYALFKMKDGTFKSVSFGAKGYTDYLLSKDKERRDRYRKRHAKDLLSDTNKKGLGAGALSYWLLWGPTTSLSTNITLYKKKFNL